MDDFPWEPLPPDVAAWMGLDEAMVPFALDLAGVDSVPKPARPETPITTW